MKKAVLLFILVSMIIVWSCGGGSGEKQSSDMAEKKETKKYSLKTQEGMMKKLQEFGITVPDELAFVEITKKSDGYSAKFENQETDEAAAAALDEWRNGLFTQLTSDGWTKRDIRVDETMVGIVINESLFFKPQGGSSSLTNSLDVSTAYSPAEKSYTLYVVPSAH